MHGVGGEDGTAQELLEILGIPFTGPGAAACARCIDKVLAKHAMRAAGIPTPDWFAFNETAFRELGAADALGGLEERLGFPLVVKPQPRRLSSSGRSRRALRRRAPAPSSSSSPTTIRATLERFVEGRDAVEQLFLGSEPRPIVAAIPVEVTPRLRGRYEIGRTDFRRSARPFSYRACRRSPRPRSRPTGRSAAKASPAST